MKNKTVELDASREVIRRKDLLSTGSTLLNLACSGHANGGFLKGKYYLIVGDSDSGKTFFSMTCFAESTINEQFKNHRLIYDNTEDGMLIDLESMFNESVADRMEPPEVRDDNPVNSKTIEEFYYHLDDAIKDGRPFIYVLDSMDGLDTEADDKKFQQHKKAYKKKQEPRSRSDEGNEEDDKKVAGSYGTSKAKKNSEFLRKALSDLRKMDSILIVISQTRDDPQGYGDGKVSSGGRALKFYATMQIWTSIKRKIKKNVNDKDRDIGSRIKIDVRRNRLTGKRVNVEVDIYPTLGIDDTGTCVDYLVEEQYWSISKQTIDAKGLKVSGTREKIIRFIEKNNLEWKLHDICEECWKSIDDACALKRKNKYAQAEVSVS